MTWALVARALLAGAMIAVVLFVAGWQNLHGHLTFNAFAGFLTALILAQQPVTLDVADEAVGLRASPGAKTSIEDIQRKTAEFYKLDVKDFHSPQRARRVARPRQVAMYLSRKLTTRSLPEIGRRFGGRDHTTVLHACRRIEALIVEDAMFRQEVDFLSQMLQRKGDL